MLYHLFRYNNFSTITHKSSMATLHCKTLLLLAALYTLSAFPATAQQGGASGTRTLNVVSAAEASRILFQLDAPVETIKGTATDMKGAITFDPQNLEATKGEILVSSGSLNTGLTLRDNHMIDKDWLDVSSYPTISCKIEKLIDVLVKNRDAQTGNIHAEAKAIGTFTLHGTTKPLTASLSLTFNKQTGQIIVNTQFDIPWKEYGIKGKRTMGMTVGDIVKVDVLITGKS